MTRRWVVRRRIGLTIAVRKRERMIGDPLAVAAFAAYSQLNRDAVQVKYSATR